MSCASLLYNNLIITLQYVCVSVCVCVCVCVYNVHTGNPMFYIYSYLTLWSEVRGQKGGYVQRCEL